MDSLIAKLYKSPKTIISMKDLALIWQEKNEENLHAKAAYYVRKKALIRLTRGIFAKDLNYSLKELATSLYTPSYISFETVLREAGLIFQHYEGIYVTSKWSKVLKIDKYSLIFRKIKDLALFNPSGIINHDNYSIATTERAFVDMLYLFPNYHYDNLESIDWQKCIALAKVFNNKQLLIRINKYQKDYDK